MNVLFQFSFFYYAIAISVILSFLFALISFILVTRKLTFLAIGTEHAAFGGAGLARIMNWDQLTTTLIFCTIVTVLAGRSHKKTSDLGISLFFSGAMAFGMILLSLEGNNSFNLVGFLFGDLIGITKKELIFSFITVLTIMIIMLPSLGKITYLSFDREAAIISGVNAELWDTIVYIVLSISIILGIKLVGVLLVAAMTVLPAAFALLWEQNISKTLGISCIFSLFAMILGIFCSFFLDLAPGALIVAIAVSVYFIGLGLKNKFIN